MGNIIKSWEKYVQQILKNMETDIGQRYPSIFAMLLVKHGGKMMIDHDRPWNLEVWYSWGKRYGFLLPETDVAQVGWATEKAFDGAPQAPPLLLWPSPREWQSPWFLGVGYGWDEPKLCQIHRDRWSNKSWGLSHLLRIHWSIRLNHKLGIPCIPPYTQN